MGKQERAVYTAKEVADLFGLSLSTTWARIWDGTIPSKKLGGRVIIPKHGVEELLDLTPETVEEA